MKKYEYLSQLEKLLSALPEAERRDALNYYEEYFDAAGTENEDATAAELGDPAEAARKILEGEGLAPDAAPAEASETPTAPEPPVADPQPAPKHHGPSAKTMWLIFAVIIVAALLVQLAVLALSFAKPSGGTASMVTVPMDEETADTGEESAASGLARTENQNEPAATEEAATSADGDFIQAETIDFERNEVKNATFYIDYGSVTIVASDEVTSPSLSCTNVHRDWRRVYAMDTTDTLRVDYTVPANYDLGQDDMPQFTLTVPTSRAFTFDTLHLEVDMGDVTLRGGIEADTVDVTVGMGNFSGKTVTAKAFSAGVSMGNFDLDRLNGAQTTTVKADMGSIGLTVEGSADEYDLDLTTDMGSVAFNGQTYEDGGCHVRTNKLNPRSVTLTASMGDVVLATTQ